MSAAEVFANVVGGLSLVVGLTALAMAGFSVWLSWQFYKESRGQNDRVQDAVSRIENVVTEMHGNVSKIVQHAVEAWVRASSPSDQETQLTENLTDSFDELKAKVESLEKGKDSSLRLDMMRLIERNQAKTEGLIATLREARLRSIFPTIEPEPKAPAVRVQQVVKTSSATWEEGEITLEVLRESKVITGTGHLGLELNADAAAMVSLIGGPVGYEKLNVRSGFGHAGQFNVHLHPQPGDTLRTGTYLIRYRVDAG